MLLWSALTLIGLSLEPSAAMMARQPASEFNFRMIATITAALAAQIVSQGGYGCSRLSLHTPQKLAQSTRLPARLRRRQAIGVRPAAS